MVLQADVGTGGRAVARSNGVVEGRCVRTARGLLLGLLGAAFGQLIATSRDPAPENQRAAQQARLLLFSIALAATPWAARVFSLMLGVGPVPYNL